jgi:sec-independent protein translocase protein TatB
MFDIGWTELLVIAVVLIVVVGPKDLPPMLRAFGKMTQRARKVAGEFRAQFDEALREADIDEVRQTLNDAQKLNPMNSLREAMNPLRQMGNDIKADLQRSTSVDTKSRSAWLDAGS